MAMAGALREAVRRVEKNAPIYGVAPLEQQFEPTRAASLSDVAADRLLIVAADGRCRIYGLIQYSIATRTHEIGIRMQ